MSQTSTQEIAAQPSLSQPATEPAYKPKKPREGSKYNTPLPVSASTAEQLERLNQRWRTAEHFPPGSLDFGKERLVGARFLLTSGSMRIQDIAVHKSDARYTITYKLSRPGIGTTDIRQTMLYAVLPQDGLHFSVIERSEASELGTRISAKTGLVGRVYMQPSDLAP
ncbi:MAG: hypothetical protein AAFY19_04085 [Pseudomonadota bacterium]